MLVDSTPSSSSAPQPDRQATPRRRRVSIFLLPCLILLAAAPAYLGRLDSLDQYHVDEGEWIFAGKLYTDLFFFRHDFANPLWTDQFGTWGSFNPQVGKYIIGLSLHAFAGLDAFPPPPPRVREGFAGRPGEAEQYQLMRQLGYYRYSFDHGLEWNRRNNRLPPPRLLAAARRGVALCGLAAGVFVFFIARLLLSDRAGWAAMALFLANPMVFACSRRAMTDIPCLAFVLLGLWATLRALHVSSARGPARWLWPPLAALGWGLALGTKLNALAPYGASLLFTSVWLVWNHLGPRTASSATPQSPEHAMRNAECRIKNVIAKPASVACALFPLLSLLLLPAALFILTNPFLYHGAFTRYLDFPTKFHFMLYLGEFITLYQPELATSTLISKLARTVQFLFADASLVHRLTSFGLEALLFPIALFAFLRGLARRRPFFSHCVPHAALLWISLATWAATILWLPLPWDRFLLPLVPFYVLVLGFGAARRRSGL